MKSIVILASGSGSNAENIIRYFESNKKIQISAVFSNKKDAFVLERASKLEVPAYYFNKKAFQDGQIVQILGSLKPDLIVLAGFLWKIPSDLVATFGDRMINIHPALLPNYGGKGMYGMHVHKAVKENGDSKTGISIHYVNEHYDQGNLIFQASCEVLPTDTPEDIAAKVHELEYQYFPSTIEKLLDA